MKKWLSFFVLTLVFNWSGISVAADDNHQDSTEPSVSSSRPSEDSKKPVSLAEKLSACLTERPNSSHSSSKETKGEPKTWGSTGNSEVSQPRGEALFTKYCASCHSAGGSQGPISNWERAAVRAGTDMPPSGTAQIPSEELSILQDYLRSR